MSDASTIFFGWLIYLLAGIVYYLIFWRVTRPVKRILAAYCLRAVMLALIATPWFAGADSHLLAPALMVVMMDAITVSGQAAVRAFIPLFLSTVLALLLAVLFFFLRKKTRRPGSRLVK